MNRAKEPKVNCYFVTITSLPFNPFFGSLNGHYDKAILLSGGFTTKDGDDIWQTILFSEVKLVNKLHSRLPISRVRDKG
jgi:hypothetical protein